MQTHWNILFGWVCLGSQTKGSGKDKFLGDPDWLSEMQYNTISLLEPFPEPFVFVEQSGIQTLGCEQE